MVYSTPYIGNYVCITLVMMETFLLNGVDVGWSILTVMGSYITAPTLSFLSWINLGITNNSNVQRRWTFLS